MKRTKPNDGDVRHRTKFIWFPRYFASCDCYVWLKTVTIRQIFIDGGFFVRDWYDVDLVEYKKKL